MVGPLVVVNLCRVCREESQHHFFPKYSFSSWFFILNIMKLTMAILLAWMSNSSFRQFVRVFVCVFTFEVPFKRLFAPTFRNRMSNIFRDSESLGKSNGKKWSQIWIFLFENCLKLPLNFYFFFADFALQNMVETTLPNGLNCISLILAYL